ncbi:MAG: hypothetical protein AB7V77_00615 [Candidatus Woesearchaeota archaeon]
MKKETRENLPMYFGTALIILMVIFVPIFIFTGMGEQKTEQYYFIELDVVLDCKIYSGGSSHHFKCYDNGEEIEIYTNSFIELEDYQKIQKVKLG